jgi:archaellum component FlaG (FlaF/FlaG flagellin family)
LIVVVIAGGILIYGYTMGWFGRLGGEGEMGILSIDESSAIGSTDTITVYLRNVGSSSVTIDAVYVEGEVIDNADVLLGIVDLDTPTPIPEGSVGTVTIDTAATALIDLIAGTTYEVKIVGVDNTQIVFSMKAD